MIESEIPNNYGTHEIKVEKERLGPLEIVHFEGTVEETHKRLGETVRDQVWLTAARKLEEYDSYEDFLTDLQMMHRCLEVVKDKSNDTEIDLPIRNAVKDYVTALQSWAGGASLLNINHEYIKRFAQEFNFETSGSSEVLAYWLQNDNVGCQSGMYRKDDGNILVWHTEEDVEDEPGSRFDAIRIGQFSLIGETGERDDRYALIYPDLLPGPAAGFAQNFFYSIDFQSFRPNEQPSILANTAVWVTWKLGESRDPAEVLRALSPYYDGYTLNTVRRLPDGTLESKKLEFAHGLIAEYKLNENPGSNLVSANVTEENSATEPALDEIDDEESNYYAGRVRRTRRALKLIESTESGVTLQTLQRMLAFRVGNQPLKGSDEMENAANSNVDVKAKFAVMFTPNGMQLAVSAGPGIRNEEVTYFEFQISN